MSTIISILNEAEPILPAGSERPVETLDQFLRRERMREELLWHGPIRAGRSDPHMAGPDQVGEPIGGNSPGSTHSLDEIDGVSERHG
jgi:hypothetical protein